MAAPYLRNHEMCGLELKSRGPKSPVSTICIVIEFAKLLPFRLLLRSDPDSEIIRAGTRPPPLLAELQGREATVNAAGHRLEFVVRAGFGDLAVGDDDDAVHMPDGGEAMGNNE
jgi:hypothetical protein